MSVLEAVIGVILVQLATTHMEATPVLVTMDTQAMGFLAWVSASTFLLLLFSIHTFRYE